MHRKLKEVAEQLNRNFLQVAWDDYLTKLFEDKRSKKLIDLVPIITKIEVAHGINLEKNPNKNVKNPSMMIRLNS